MGYENEASPVAMASGDTLTALPRVMIRVQRYAARLERALADDWKHAHHVPFAVALLVSSGLVVFAFYVNHPQIDIFPDTGAYTGFAYQILDHRQFVSGWRMPGYPALIALVFLVAGRGNLAAVTIVQGALFVSATLEVYVLAAIMLRRTWMAFIIAFLIGTNVTFIVFVKPALSEALTMWLAVSLALALVLFVRMLRARALWLVCVVTLALIMTRSEWVYLPVPLTAYLLFVAARRGRLRALLPHALLALGLIYAAVGVYCVANKVQNDYFGLTWVPRGNLLGKIMQYHMQNEAPPQYADTARIVNTYVARGDLNPNNVLDNQPMIAADHWALAEEYSLAIIEHHPVEYASKTLRILIDTMGSYGTWWSPIAPDSHFGRTLTKLQTISQQQWHLLSYFFGFAAVWLILLMWPSTSRRHIVEMMGALLLIEQLAGR